ncbi:TPA: hypothetical protein O8T96_004806 [Enterobacter asburiae]|nr:hypothetical protein [Enterobacter asburiae]
MSANNNPKYRHKADHRLPEWNKFLKKSRWTVSIEEEEDIFNIGFAANWKVKNDVWSLKYCDNDLCVIGEDHRYLPQKKGKSYLELVVAKFVVDQGYWHGYPVNTLTDPPASSLLSAWAKTPGIPKRKVMKLHTVK